MLAANLAEAAKMVRVQAEMEEMPLALREVLEAEAAIVIWGARQTAVAERTGELLSTGNRLK